MTKGADKSDAAKYALLNLMSCGGSAIGTPAFWLALVLFARVHVPAQDHSS